MLSTMDVLSDLTRQLDASVSVQRRALLGGPWSVRFTRSSGAVLHVMDLSDAWITVDGAEPVPFPAGSVAVVGPQHGHRISRRPGERAPSAIDPTTWCPGVTVVDRFTPGEVEAVLTCGRIDLDATIAHPLIAAMPPVLLLSRRERQTGLDLGRLVAEISDEIDSAGAGWQTIVNHLSSALLVRLLRTWLDAEVAPGYLRAVTHPNLGRAIAAIHARPDHPHTVSNLARTAMMSRSNFVLTFGRLVGEPPQTYLTRWRMIVASRGLRRDGWTIAQAARATGYGSEAAFSRAFRRLVGVPPGRYRSDALGREPADVARGAVDSH